MPHSAMTSRRHILAGAAAGLAAAPSAFAASKPRRFIDVHNHFNAPGGYVAPGSRPWSPAIALEELDRNGVAAAIGFLGWIMSPDDIEAGRRRAREWNDLGATMCRDYPGRFGLFAALPMLDTAGALAEMRRAFDDLHADGIGIVTNYGDHWLGDPKFDPIWQEANRRKAIVYVHPTDAPCCTQKTLSYMTSPLNEPWIEWPMNTARTILNLMTTGTLRRYPDIRFIFSHGGGVMPMLVGRIEGLSGWPAVGPEKMRELFPDGVAAEFARLRFECAQAYTKVNMTAVRSLAPDSHILFGTDYDRFPIAHSVTKFESLGLPRGVANAIAHGNAEALFPRFARP